MHACRPALLALALTVAGCASNHAPSAGAPDAADPGVELRALADAQRAEATRFDEAAELEAPVASDRCEALCLHLGNICVLAARICELTARHPGTDSGGACREAAEVCERKTDALPPECACGEAP